tara:strand:+ start:8151 stop:8522 length:372 start_codon:yes stop_codon:yes gene_type:complete
VRYCETDAMSYSHHSNYLKYYEVGRLNWLKKIGFSYFKMEKDDIILAVVKSKITFRKPAYFEDKLKIKTTLLNPPSYSLEFQYEIFKDKTLINEGYTKLIFLNGKNNKPIRCPKEITDAINNY